MSRMVLPKVQWMLRNDRHHQINQHAARAKAEIIKHGMRARSEIDELMERYRLEDLFRARSEGQKRRWANFKRFNNGGGK